MDKYTRSDISNIKRIYKEYVPDDPTTIDCAKVHMFESLTVYVYAPIKTWVRKKQ